jgi:hypothetical protein
MADRWNHTTDGYSFRFFSPEQADQILRDGVRCGRKGSHSAIERILKLEPGIERAELWQRIRRLKFPSNGGWAPRSIWSAQDDEILLLGYRTGWSGKRQAVRELLKRHPGWRPHVIWKRAAKLHLIKKRSMRWQDRSHFLWSEHDDQHLLSLAGYKAARVVARLLHRSEAAVRYRLMVLGKSSRVHVDGFSRQGLAADLHLGKRTVQRLIVEGLLEVRDPRITRESLDHLRKSGHLGSAQAEAPCTRQIPNGERTVEAVSIPSHAIQLAGSVRRSSRAERVWAEVANSLGVPVATIKRLIVRRVLKLYDPTITEKSVRDFCRRYGSLVNYEFLNRETREWLRHSMDLERASGEPASRLLVPFRKHAHKVRQCPKCGHTIRGNVFFSHIKRCSRELLKSGVQTTTLVLSGANHPPLIARSTGLPERHNPRPVW